MLRYLYGAAVAGRIPIPAPMFRVYESARAAMTSGADQDGLPPPVLRMRVAGSADPNVFLHGGLLAFESINAALQSIHRNLDSFSSILDFGCGCGRVLRLFRNLDSARFTGIDVDSDCIEWCSQNFRGSRFLAVKQDQPVDILTASIDLCYGFSVLTHMDRQLQDFWLGEVHRMLAPGGIFLCSTHGPACLPRLTEGESRRFRTGEMVVRFASANTSNLCNSFHPPDALRAQVAGRFDVLGYLPEGALGNAPQDLWILQRKPA